ncbi:hypothetical protein H0H93_011827, partial [Arthromyces matolae]
DRRTPLYFDPFINIISLRRYTPKNAPLVFHEDNIFVPTDADDGDSELLNDFTHSSRDTLQFELTADGIALRWDLRAL